MMNPFYFVLNIVIMCAMLTFLPSIAFALANSATRVGTPAWPLILSSAFRRA